MFVFLMFLGSHHSKGCGYRANVCARGIGPSIGRPREKSVVKAASGESSDRAIRYIGGY